MELLEEEEKAPVPGPKAKVELAVDAESRDIFFLVIYVWAVGTVWVMDCDRMGEMY